MAKITWDNRADSGSNAAISASIFNETKASVNALYDILDAQIGTTSTNPTANLTISGNIQISGSILPAVGSGETTSSFSLGSETAAWKDLYVSTGSIKFVSPGGGITSFGKSDVDAIKGGSFPVSSRTVGGVTFTDWSQNDVIFSTATDNTRIELNQSGRMSLIAGGTTYVAINDITDSIIIGAGAGPINTTTYLNDTTIVPEGSAMKITGSLFLQGNRAQPPLPPPGVYEGVMSSPDNSGFGLVKKINGVDTYVSAPTTIPQSSTSIPLVFTEGTPSAYTDPGPGRAEYDDGRFIKILADAPFNTGFSISCSFNIPFSASTANFQTVIVELAEIPSVSTPYNLYPTWDTDATRTFVLRPTEFPNGIVTGSFQGQFRLKGAPFVNWNFVGGSNLGYPFNYYYDAQLTGYLDEGHPIQLRIRSENTEGSYTENTSAHVILDILTGSFLSLTSTHTQFGRENGSARGEVPEGFELNGYPAQEEYPYYDPWWDLPLQDMKRLDNNDWWEFNYRTGVYVDGVFQENEDSPYNWSPSPYLFPDPDLGQSSNYYDNPSHANLYDRTYIVPINNILINANENLVNEPITGFEHIEDMVIYKAPFTGTFTFENPYVFLNAWSDGAYGEWRLRDSIFSYGWDFYGGNEEEQLPLNAYESDSFILSLRREKPNGVIETLKSGTLTVERKDWLSYFPSLEDLGWQGVLNLNDYKRGMNYKNVRDQLLAPVYLEYNEDNNPTSTVSVDLEAGDKLFFTIRHDLKQPGCAENADGDFVSNYAGWDCTDDYLRFALKYFGILDNPLFVAQDATFDSGPVSISKTHFSQGSAYFRLNDEYYPNQSPLDCYTSNVDLGVSQAGATIANGGFLCVGPLTGSADPEFGGFQGNFISCSADNVIAVGKNNVLAKDNSVTIGFGNINDANNQLLAGYQNEAFVNGGVAFGQSTVNSGSFSLTQGKFSKTFAAYSHAEGELTSTVGVASHAEGYRTATQGNHSHVEGSYNTTIGYASHAEGFQTNTAGDHSHSEGLYTWAQGNFSHAEGEGTWAMGNASHAEGRYTTSSGNHSHAEGLSTYAQGNNSHAEGEGTVAYGVSSHAEGVNTKAEGVGSHAEGWTTKAIGNYSHAEGDTTEATGNASHAEGHETKATGDNSHAEGEYTLAQGSYSHAEGLETKAIGLASHAEGYATTSSNAYSHAEGSHTNAAGLYSHAEGFNTTASGEASHAEGFSSTAIGSYSHAEGYYTKATSIGSHAEGYYTTSSAIYSHAEGHYTIANGIYSHAEGNRTLTTGSHSHTEGYRTTASGEHSHAEGTLTSAEGDSSHAEGYYTQATGGNSHAEGAFTTSSGVYSHAEGGLTKAEGRFSHAEGYSTTTIQSASHAEGYYTTAFGQGAHAEGWKTYASGNYSHAEGFYATASGQYSHAEGSRTQAIGIASHAEGHYTQALGNYSHAGGWNTIADQAYSSVVGRYNSTSSLSGQSNIELFVIGNGLGEENRSNLIEFSTNGIYINTDSLPTSDPGIPGKLYRTGSNFDELRVSL